jgi:hypothetical protein
MKIQFSDKGALSSFEIVPTPDRSILDQFRDHETGYLVVREIRTDDPKDQNVYYTLIDPATGEVVSPERRKRESADWERTSTDPGSGLRLHATRSIDPGTGQETLDETVSDETGHVVARRSGNPLSDEPRETLLASHLRRRAETSREANVPQTPQSLEERGAIWLARILRQMHFQGEAGFDEYSFFTPEAYQEWRALDPDIDRILDWVIAHFPDDSETVRAEIDRRLGRTR